MTAAALLFVSCAKKDESSDPETIQQIQEKIGVPVTVQQVSSGMIRHVEEANGTLEGVSETVLANAIGGTLGKVYAEVGKTVKKGTTVATMVLDGGSMQAVSKSNYNYAKKAYQRAVKLHKEGAVSQEQVEGARAQYEGAKIKLSQSKVGDRVKAPFTGTVLEIYQSKGKRISEKTPLVKIADLSQIKVKMQVNERAINLYKEGQRTFIISESDTLWGTITRTALAANAMTHSFRVTAIFDNPDNTLNSGMFKNIYVIVDEKTNSLKVPFEIVSFEGEKSFIYVAEGGAAVKREVVLGIRNGTEYEVVEGLSAEDMVIVTGITMISNGSNINVISE